MDRIAAVAILLAILGTGFGTLRRTLAALDDRQVFLSEFVQLFAKYVQSNAQDEATYVELVRRVTRMQAEIGGHGMMALFRPAFANFAYKNYAILPNMLPDYRRYAADWALRGQADQYASSIRDALLRYSGTLDEAEPDVHRELRNPIIWFRKGMRAIVASPFALLRSLGILSATQEAGLTASAALRVGSGILALIALVAGLIQIATGWDATVVFVRGLFTH